MLLVLTGNRDIIGNKFLVSHADIISKNKLNTLEYDLKDFKSYWITILTFYSILSQFFYVTINYILLSFGPSFVD